MKYNSSDFIRNIQKTIKNMTSNRLYIMIFIVVIIAFLIFIAMIAFFYMQNMQQMKDSVKEGFDKQVSIYDNVKKVIISQKSGSWDWLNIAEFKIYDQNGRELAFNEYSATSSNGIYQNNQGYRIYNLADNNHGTMFHSGGGDCTLTFTINNPTRVSKIYMKQRTDCCQGRLRAYKMRLLNSSDTTMADINLADSFALYNLYNNAYYADWFYFKYPVDPQIAIRAAAKAAKDAEEKAEAERAAAEAAQAAAAKAKSEADKAKRSSATTLYAIEEADAAERSAKDDADEAAKTAKKAKDLAKEADIDAANSNANANNANADVKKATNTSSEFQQQVNQAITASENEIKALAASITPQPKSEAVPYNSAEINQF